MRKKNEKSIKKSLTRGMKFGNMNKLSPRDDTKRAILTDKRAKKLLKKVKKVVDI